MGIKAWQLGSPGTWIYRFYDGLREQLNRKLVRFLIESALTRNGCTVLEAGSGPAFASSLMAADPRVDLSVAVDIDPEALQEARVRDAHLAAIVADLNHLPLRAGSVDLCWNSSTIEHLDDPNRALSQMVYVTRPSGKVFVGVPNLFGPLGFQRWISETSAGIWIGPTFSRAELAHMLLQNGLRPVKTIFYFFRFFVGVLAANDLDCRDC
jgi:SAM-dependent methyltransferase